MKRRTAGAALAAGCTAPAAGYQPSIFGVLCEYQLFYRAVSARHEDGDGGRRRGRRRQVPGAPRHRRAAAFAVMSGIAAIFSMAWRGRSHRRVFRPRAARRATSRPVIIIARGARRRASPSAFARCLYRVVRFP